MQSGEQLWGVKEAAEYLRVSPSWVYRMAERGTLPHRKVGRAVRFVPGELRAWVQKQPGTSGG